MRARVRGGRIDPFFGVRGDIADKQLVEIKVIKVNLNNADVRRFSGDSGLVLDIRFLSFTKLSLFISNFLFLCYQQKNVMELALGSDKDGKVSGYRYVP
jgi:hypothetical protein